MSLETAPAGASGPTVKHSVSPGIGSRLGGLIRRPEAGALIGTVGVYIFFTVFGGPNFTSAAGTASWLNVAAELGIVALPVGLLMISGELDLSVGSVLAASSMTLAVVSGYWNMPLGLGITLALLLGLITGLVNGIIVTRTELPSFIVTLATNFGLVGLTLGLSRVVTGTVSVSVTPNPLVKSLF